MDEVHGGKMFWRQLNSTVWVRANSYPGQLLFLLVLPVFPHVRLRFPLSTLRNPRSGRESFQTRNLSSYTFSLFCWHGR